MKQARVIKHSITIEYKCPEKESTHSVKLINPNIQTGQYFSDWTYDYVEFKCEFCDKTHRFEI